MLERGFKSWCEIASINFRKELGKSKDSPLLPHELAKYLNVTLVNPSDLNTLSQEAKRTLLVTESHSWSAVTISRGTSHVIIYNSSHADSRQANDIMHELSHVILQHKPETNYYSPEINVFLRKYNTNQEDEANCLAATLLLPKDVLLKIKFQKMSDDQAARFYGISKQLLSMRLNVSGINHIYNRVSKKHG